MTSIRITDKMRDELGEHIIYCSTCVTETGDAGLGWCRKHMDPALRAILRADRERTREARERAQRTLHSR